MSTGSSIVTYADAGATNVSAQLLPANPNRKEALIGSLDANTVNVRVGDSAVSATRGIPIIPGATIALCMKGEIYVITESGTADVAYAEILE